MLKKNKLVLSFISGLGLMVLAVGCVSINDASVQVHPPDRVDVYQRNVLDKCTPHLLPSRLILASMSAGSTLLQGGGADVNNQKDFDLYWTNITPDLSGGGVATADALKPNVNWEIQTVRFLPIALSNSCEKVQAYSMETDCYQITLPLYRYVEGKNCSTPSSYPVFIYIYPKANLPLTVMWFKTPYMTPTPSP